MNTRLQLRRDQIEELGAVKGLLAKLQAVFDLPRRLRAALEQGALEVAADVYADAAPLLKRYGHKVGAFFVSRCLFRLFARGTCVPGSLGSRKPAWVLSLAPVRSEGQE